MSVTDGSALNVAHSSMWLTTLYQPIKLQGTDWSMQGTSSGQKKHYHSRHSEVNIEYSHISHTLIFFKKNWITLVWSDLRHCELLLSKCWLYCKYGNGPLKRDLWPICDTPSLPDPLLHYAYVMVIVLFFRFLSSCTVGFHSIERLVSIVITNATSGRRC